MVRDSTPPGPPSPVDATDGAAARSPSGIEPGAAGHALSRSFNASPVGISVSRVRDGMIVDMNEEFLRILGFTREEVIGRTSLELNLWTAPHQREIIVSEFREKGFFSPRPTEMRRKDGSLVTVLFSASALAAGEEPHTIAWVMDVTGRLRVEERLRASEERWRSLVENAPVAILTLDRDASVLSVNRSITGRPVSEYLGRAVYEFLHPDHRERGRAMVEAILGGGPPATGEFPIIGPDGAVFWFLVGIAPIVPSRPADGVILVASDINKRRLVEEALRESRQRFSDIVRSLGDWVWEVDTSSRLTYSSPQIEGLLGYTADEMLGRSPSDSVTPEDRARYLAGMEALMRSPGPFRDLEIWHLHRDGHRVCLEVSGVPVYDAKGVLRGFRGVAHDVTERLREEAEVQQARRVESLGVLAGGIAHDFNNLLTAILGNAELALAELPEGAGARVLVAQIQSAGQHAADLTRQMLAYAGRGRFEIQPVDLTTAVREMTQLLGASVPKKVELVLDLDEGLPAVEADPAQLRQLVMNLVINAAEAIGDREGRIGVRTVEGESTDRFRPDLTLGKIDPGRRQVCVEIADSGHGIAQEALSKIFDPFFTTKFTGRGLGLAAVQGIVRRHGGTIMVRSAVDTGSTFLVCFPAADSASPVAAPAAPRAPGASPATATERGGMILLVDDEASVRTMAARMVKALGFQVLTAEDGRAAVAVAAGEPGLRAVLLDLTMPHMDGRETFRELRRLRPDLPGDPLQRVRRPRERRPFHRHGVQRLPAEALPPRGPRAGDPPRSRGLNRRPPALAGGDCGTLDGP